MKNIWILFAIPIFVGWNIKCTTIRGCLDCWNTLCGGDYGNTNLEELCPSQCLENYTIAGIVAELGTCCNKADTYVSTVSESLASHEVVSDASQCQSAAYNYVSSSVSLDDLDNEMSPGRQYVLYSAIQFNCSGCVSKVSVYSFLGLTEKQVFTVEIWSDRSTDNQTLVLSLKQQISLELLVSDSVESDNYFTSSKEVNDSLCFESGDVFGITGPSSFTFLAYKDAGDRKTYARDLPNCDSLKDIFYPEASETIIEEPLVAVEVTAAPNAESTSSSQSFVSSSSSTTTTATSNSESTISLRLASSSASHTSTRPYSTLVETTSLVISTASSTSSIQVTETMSSLETFVETTVGTVVVALVSLLIVTLLVIIALIVGIFVCKNSKRDNDNEIIEMVGHVGRHSRDSLDFQSHVATRPFRSASVNTSQLSTPTPPPMTQNGGNMLQSNYYDNPTILDTSQLNLYRNSHDRREHDDYTPMHSRSEILPPYCHGGSRSTLSDNSMTKHAHHPHYDVPRNTSANSDYDEPIALAKQFGTLDPYQQSTQNLGEPEMERGRNREYFVLEVDSEQTINRAAQPLPIYHVLEPGYHVPSALERDSAQPTFNIDKVKQQPFFEEQQHYWEPAERTESIYDQLSAKKCRELRRQDITCVQEIGTGQFGTVWNGVWLLHGGTKKNVAVKVCNTNAQESEKARLLREGARMMQFFHTHVVQLFGIVTVGEPIMLIIELMKEGDLKEYLKCTRPDIRKKPALTPQQLVKFCRDIASGMKHLAKKQFVHRDLAARNIMLNEKLVCKIGDFGMTRSSSHTYDLSKPEQVPLKWTAPEALKNRQYSEKSDVYSYGMVMYEIWSLGRSPFPLEEDIQIIVNFIAQGRIMAPPPGCPREIYRLMATCWHLTPSERPTFDTCSDFLQSDNETLLQWNSEDCDGLPAEAFELGVHVHHGYELYKDLQYQYRPECN